MTCPLCQKEIVVDDSQNGNAKCQFCGYLVGAFPKPIYEDAKIHD